MPYARSTGTVRSGYEDAGAAFKGSGGTPGEPHVNPDRLCGMPGRGLRAHDSAHGAPMPSCRRSSCHHARPTDVPFVVVVQPNRVVPCRCRTPFADIHAPTNEVT